MNALLVLSFIFPWLLVGFVCWLAYQFARQNGRILIRLEVIEKRLSDTNRLNQNAAIGPTRSSRVARGSIAPEFELADLSGERRKLSDFLGQQILLIFFNPSCGFCQQMARDLAELPSSEDARVLPLVVSTGDVQKNRHLVKEHEIKCPVLIQEQMEIASKYQVNGTPMGYIIDKHGKIASEMAVGSQALLALANHWEEEIRNNGHKTYKGNKPLSESKIAREGLKPGTPAPEFTLPRLSGGDLSLKDFLGRKLLLLFSAPDCGPCNQLAPKLEELHRANHDVQILMVSRGDLELNRAKVKEHGLTFPIALQRQWEISRLYAIFATPIAYLIDKEGIIASDVATGLDSIIALFSRSTTLHKTGSRESKKSGAVIPEGV